MAGYYQLIEGYEGGFAFTLRAGNHEVIFESRIFWSRQAAMEGVDRFRVLVHDNHHLRSTRNARGQHVLELLDENLRVLGWGSACNSTAGLNANRASVRRNAASQGFRGLVRKTLVMP